MPSNKYKANKAVLLNWLETKTKRSNLFIHFEEINEKSEALRKIILYFKNNKNDRFVFSYYIFSVWKRNERIFTRQRKKNGSFDLKKSETLTSLVIPLKKYKYDPLLLVFLLLGYVCTVIQVLEDFAVCDWWRCCKALRDVKFSQILWRQMVEN